MDDLILNSDPTAELLRSLREIGAQQRETLDQVARLSHELEGMRETLAQTKSATGKAISGLDERGAALEGRVEQMERQRWSTYALFGLVAVLASISLALWTQIAPVLRLIATACGA
jgi:hypothetical protein